MEGLGALRLRYLPRWHHTGSYQLYPGEMENLLKSSQQGYKINADAFFA